jgi:ubiquinone/menaquinone biosynthesis C-methylase UbiE
MAQEKTHYDYIDIIGKTHVTTRNYVEKRWNQYYFKSYSYTVDKMLGTIDGQSIIDIGTSHGSWFRFLKAKGFGKIYGVEIDSGRTELAKKCGYDLVYNCDAANVPLADNSTDFAVSNDVFVHILRLEDKIAVLKKVEKILRPGGIFILNHAMSRAFKYGGYRVEKYCSFFNLDEFLTLITGNTKFEIVDIKPTFFMHRNKPRGFFRKAIRHLTVMMPFGVSLLFLIDYFNARKLNIQESDAVYVKLQKKVK